MFFYTQHEKCCFVTAILLLLLASSARSEMTPAAQKVYNDLIDAVKQDDNAAYRAARTAALEQEDGEFDALLETLYKTETWQALAIKGGLRVRREKPDVADEFDEGIEWLKNNPTQTRAGNHVFQYRKFSKLFPTAEDDWLRYEAMLTEKADLPTDQSGRDIQLPGWIAFRRAIFGSYANRAEDMRVIIMMLRDMPEWLEQPPVWGLYASIRRSSNKVEEYVPELVSHYKRLRLRQGHTMSTFVGLIRAIAEANTKIALPALLEIREFEQTTGEKIQSQASALRARLKKVEKLYTQAIREGRQEDAQNLAMERRELKAKDVSLVSSQLRAVRRELDELIEKHQKARTH